MARSEITKLLAEGKPVETSCDACGERYEITTRELTEVLRTSDASIDSETFD